MCRQYRHVAYHVSTINNTIPAPPDHVRSYALREKVHVFVEKRDGRIWSHFKPRLSAKTSFEKLDPQVGEVKP